MDELLGRALSGALSDEDMELMRQIFTSCRGFFKIVGDKNTTIARLRKMMFGATGEKSEDILCEAEQDASKDPQPPSDAPSDETADDEPQKGPSQSPPGRGRRSADDYSGAKHRRIDHL